jgi:shikimate dehydrogenase
MTDHYAVIGNPIAHSRSPDIHAAFARALDHDICYERLLAPKEGFREIVEALRQSGARGANVTVPFKFEAFQYANKLTPRAQTSGAVNTLRFDGDIVLGDNTDGVGLTRDIVDNLHVALSGARILLLGAGGAAFGVAGALLDARPASLVITNRTFAKAEELAAKYASTGFSNTACAMSLADLADQKFDVVINATSASLSNEIPLVPPRCFMPAALAYDMMYGKGETAFLQLAARAGARTADGVGMLVEQAAEAFFVWRGVRPTTAEVIAMLKS